MKKESNFKIGDLVLTMPINADGDVIAGEGTIIKFNEWSVYPYEVLFSNGVSQPFKEEELTIVRGEKIRGFELVKGVLVGQLPVRADRRSAGYDFSSPIEATIEPHSQVLIWTNVKAYMLEDEVLDLYVRSSIGIKKGLTLANTVGIIDSSYYENEDNDGNIGICLRNNTDKVVKIEKGERIAQGVFTKYLTIDNDVCINETRKGGIGSSGK